MQTGCQQQPEYEGLSGQPWDVSHREDPANKIGRLGPTLVYPAIGGGFAWALDAGCGTDEPFFQSAGAAGWLSRVDVA